MKSAAIAGLLLLLAESAAFAFTSPACVSAAKGSSPLTSTAFSCSVPVCQGGFTGSTQYYACDCVTGTNAGTPASGCTVGSDSNAGTSSAAPLQTFAAARGKFSGLQPGDRIHFCRGGVFQSDGGNWSNTNVGSTGAKAIVMDYLPSWATGDPGPPRIYVPPGDNGFNLDHGTDTTTRAGYSFSGLHCIGDGSSTVNGTNNVCVFGYNRVGSVDLCDIEANFLNIGFQMAGGNTDGDHNPSWHTRNLYSHDNGGQGFLGGDDDFQLLNSLFVNNGFDRALLNHNVYMGPPDHATAGTTYLIQGNELYQSCMSGGSCSATSMVLHGQIINPSFIGNYVHEDTGAAGNGCYGIGIIPGYPPNLEYFQNIIIRGNTVVNVGGNGINVSAMTTGLIENNVVSMTGGNSVDVGLTASNDGVNNSDPSNTNVTIRNNTVRVDVGVAIAAVDAGTGYIIANNAAQMDATSGTAYCFKFNQSTGSYTVIDYNSCYGGLGATIKWEQSTTDTFATWKTNTGFDTHSLNATNPLFTSPSTIDFSLQSGSPLRDVGTNTYAAGTDTIGTVRPQNAVVDIGAFEFIVSTSFTAGKGAIGIFGGF